MVISGKLNIVFRPFTLRMKYSIIFSAISMSAMEAELKEGVMSTLDAIAEHKRGRISQMMRLRADNGQYHWFSLRARPLLGVDGEVIRCVGVIADVTDTKMAEERLLYD
ncbi:MAG: PAS domain-containing protein, partial [Sphingomonadales bacterium]|nr:PAS domain-containing protein [Sphingomonadales bacterium]